MRVGRNGVVEIGNARGKIAVYLDETEAIDLAYLYDPRDVAHRELMEAVEVAYPKERDE
jgi:hypothetical protein